MTADNPPELSIISKGAPLVLVGGGRMGRALLSGWVGMGLSAEAVVVIEPDAAAAEALSHHWPELAVHGAISMVSGQPAIIVLAVKPQIMDEVLAEMDGLAGALFISIAAGKSLNYFAARLGEGQSIVRVMPNTPAAVGAGISVACANALVTADQRAVTQALMAAVGEVLWIEDEQLMDAVTAVSGSGPAYVFLLTECLAKAGEKAGLDGPLAMELARQTVIGAGRLMQSSDDTAADLRENVTSPGGTTQAALEVLMRDDRLFDLFEEAVEAARQRSADLSN